MESKKKEEPKVGKESKEILRIPILVATTDAREEGGREKL
jgi:hypothetical protein